MPACLLEDRGIVCVAGEDARAFLQGVVTCNMDKVAPGASGFGALLTPQGKIIVDFIVVDRGSEGFLLDCPLTLAPELKRRLGMYRLRAKVEIEEKSAAVVAVFWGEEAAVGEVIADPRNEALGGRMFGRLDDFKVFGGWEPDVSAYEAHRIGLGIPKGGQDFAYGDTFPHEANMDLLHGLDFRKGCYVGQEVVSRVEHRGLARKRICRIEHAGQKASQGARIFAGDREIGVVGSGMLGLSLAMVRLDRWEEAQSAGVEVRVEDGPVIDALIPPR